MKAAEPTAIAGYYDWLRRLLLETVTDDQITYDNDKENYEKTHIKIHGSNNNGTAIYNF